MLRFAHHPRIKLPPATLQISAPVMRFAHCNYTGRTAHFICAGAKICRLNSWPEPYITHIPVAGRMWTAQFTRWPDRILHIYPRVLSGFPAHDYEYYTAHFPQARILRRTRNRQIPEYTTHHPAYFPDWSAPPHSRPITLRSTHTRISAETLLR